FRSCSAPSGPSLLSTLSDAPAQERKCLVELLFEPAVGASETLGNRFSPLRIIARIVSIGIIARQCAQIARLVGELQHFCLRAFLRRSLDLLPAPLLLRQTMRVGNLEHEGAYLFSERIADLPWLDIRLFDGIVKECGGRQNGVASCCRDGDERGDLDQMVDERRLAVLVPLIYMP